MPTYYSLETIQNLMQKYRSAGGYSVTLEEGCLGYGTTMLYAEPEKKLKTFIIQERYLNEWSSTHTIRGYQKPPKKYLDMLEKLKQE